MLKIRQLVLQANNRHFPAHPGVSTVEYCVIAACVLLGSLVGLGALGQDLFSQWNHFGQSLSPAQAHRATAQMAMESQPAPGQTNAATWGRSLQLTLQDGSQITLNGYPDNMTQSIMTVGANGTTSRLLATLERLTDELLAKGEITEEQASALRLLANRGHDLAEREKFIEDYLTNSQNGRPQTGEAVTYKGKTYGGLDTFSRSLDVLNSGTKKESQAAFDDAYQQALNSDALQDPAIRAVISSLVQDIGSIADVFGGETSAFLTSDKYQTYQDLLEATASKQTHQDSAGICTQGNSTDSGVHCQ